VARLRRVVLDRLIRYYRYLAELTARESVETITSAHLGAALDVDPSQVRKDFGSVGLVGMSHIGYDVCEACRAIRMTVGFDRPYTALLIGAGKLGSAVLASAEFERYGLRIVAVFDADPFKVGRRIEGFTIMPMDQLTTFIGEHGIRLAILATPGEAAQELADTLVDQGIRAIWNFTPTRLSVPKGVLARNERFSIGLAEIAYHLKAGGRRGPPTGECRASRASRNVRTPS
jgi:redox-sensing transcriptional repressor